MLRDFESAVHMPFTVFLAAAVFAAEAEFMQIFVGVTQRRVLKVTAAEPVHAKETFVFQAVDLVLGKQADRNETTGCAGSARST